MRPAAGQLGAGQQCGPGEQVSDLRPLGGGGAGICFHFPPSVSTRLGRFCIFTCRFLETASFSFLLLRSLFVFMVFFFPTHRMKSSLFNPLSPLDILIELILARNNNKKCKKNPAGLAVTHTVTTKAGTVHFC